MPPVDSDLFLRLPSATAVTVTTGNGLLAPRLTSRRSTDERDGRDQAHSGPNEAAALLDIIS